MLDRALHADIDAAAAAVVVHGRLTAENAGAFLTRVAEACPATTDIRIDLSDASLIDSSGLGALKALARRQRMHLGGLVVQGAEPHTSKLLALIGVPQDVSVPGALG